MELCEISSALPYYIPSFAGPTHVLVVRGLEENADEEMLRYEFAKHAPIKVGKKLTLVIIIFLPAKSHVNLTQLSAGYPSCPGQIYSCV